MIATDIARVLPTLAGNLDSFSKDSKACSGSSTVMELSWTGEKSPTEGPGSILALQMELSRCSEDGWADVIVCSDCCYNSSMIQPLMDTLSKVSSSVMLYVILSLRSLIY